MVLLFLSNCPSANSTLLFLRICRSVRSQHQRQTWWHLFLFFFDGVSGKLVLELLKVQFTHREIGMYVFLSRKELSADQALIFQQDFPSYKVSSLIYPLAGARNRCVAKIDACRLYSRRCLRHHLLRQHYTPPGADFQLHFRDNIVLNKWNKLCLHLSLHPPMKL